MPWEHRGWQPVRRRVYSSMLNTGVAYSRRLRFWTCADRVHVLSSPSSGEIDLRVERCHDRFCLPCGQIRSREIAESVEKRMKEATNKLSFITLTVRGRPSDALKSMISRLSDAWKELRRLKGWRASVGGGVIMLEVKWSATSGGHWHPHYHIICEGKFVDEAWLKLAWKLITRDSDQVKVKPVTSPREALAYVSKYASKPMDSSFTMRPRLMDEAMRALKAVRLVSCFGSWHGTPLKRQKEAADETEWISSWVYEGTVDDLHSRAIKGDPDAKKLLATVERYQRLRHTFIERCRGPDENSASTSTAA